MSRGIYAPGVDDARAISGITLNSKNALCVNPISGGADGGLLTLQKVVLAKSTPVVLTPELTAKTTIACNEVGATDDTITDSDSNFLKAGFAVGDYIYVSGSTSNDGTYQIKTIVAGTITVADTDDLVTEAATASITITKVKDITSTTDGFPVGAGVKVMIKAKSANTGTITIGGTSARAINSGTFHVKLESNEEVEVSISNLNKFWFDGETGEGVEVMLEA